MDVFVRYRVGSNTGFAKVIYNEREMALSKIGRPDLESLEDASWVKILSNDDTKHAAVKVSPGVCIVGEERCVSSDTNEWHLKRVTSPNEIGECRRLMLREVLVENRNKQKGKLIDVLNDVSGDGWVNDQDGKIRVKNCIKGCLDVIGALDERDRNASEALGRFLRYRDHGNAGLAEILEESRDSVTVKYLTNEGTKDACGVLLASKNDDYVCIVGKAKTYDKMNGTDSGSVSLSLVEDDDELRLCQYIADNGAVLLDNLKKQKEELASMRTSVAMDAAVTDFNRALLSKIEDAIDTAKAYISRLEKELHAAPKEVDSAIDEEEEREV